MSFASSGDRCARSAINVTPLIDVLLILLILFMVIQPNVVRGLAATDPPSSSGQSAARDAPAIVLTVEGSTAAPAYRMDGHPVAAQDLAGSVRQAVQVTGRRNVFVLGDADLDYAEVALAVDAAVAAGLDQVDCSRRAAPVGINPPQTAHFLRVS